MHVVPVYGTRIWSPSNVAVPVRETAHSVNPPPLASAVAVQLIVEPLIVPRADPATCSTPKHVAEKLPATTVADCSVAVHRKFAHELTSDVPVGVTDCQVPPSSWTVGVGFVVVWLNISKQPALRTAHNIPTYRSLFFMAYNSGRPIGSS